ncbi:MAG: hypothetical protein ACFB00_10120 [Parvularculaceae bacterium]
MLLESADKRLRELVAATPSDAGSKPRTLVVANDAARAARLRDIASAWADAGSTSFDAFAADARDIEEDGRAPFVVIVDAFDAAPPATAASLVDVAGRAVVVAFGATQPPGDLFLATDTAPDDDATAAIVRAAVNEATRRRRTAKELGELFSVVSGLHTSKVDFRTREDAARLALFLSHAFPDPSRARVGLLELMLNAVEHGILGVGFDEKSRLIEAGAFEAEITRRLADPAYGDRTASVVVARKNDGVYAVVADPGPGFDWREYVKFSPARANHRNGRGVQIARLASFDKLAFNEAGNQASAFCRVVRASVADENASATERAA